MEFLTQFLDLFLHLDRFLAEFVSQHGVWVYALLFAIVFAETGFVVMPLLPGDSLLFVAGAIAAAGGMEVGWLMALLVAAALCGDNVNYWFGRWLGPHVFKDGARFLNRAHLDRAHGFFDRHGGKAVILARFVPIVRTMMPFVAGVGRMRYPLFLAFSLGGALLWVGLLVPAGYFFGNIPMVKHNLSLVILGIVFLSISPGIYHFAQTKLRASRSA
jgi:membrane-associated protein